MSEKRTDELVPAHEAILAKIAETVLHRSIYSMEYFTLLVGLCDVLRKMKIPEQHLSRVIAELKVQRELSGLPQAPIDEAIRDLEARLVPVTTEREHV